MSKPNEANKLTLAIVNIISSWTVNNYYNTLHQYAAKMHSLGNSSSITDAYVNVVNQYLSTLDNNTGYKKSIQSLHTYCLDHTAYTGMSFSDWIKEIVKQFVPTDYYNIMTNDQQDTMLRSVIVNSLRQYSKELIGSTELLNNVIMRLPENKMKTITSLHSIMVKNLLAGRQTLFQAVYAASIKTNSKEPDTAIKSELADLLKNNIELKHKLTKTQKLIDKQKKIIDSQKDALRRLSNEYSVLKNKTDVPQHSPFRPVFSPRPPPVQTAKVELVEEKKPLQLPLIFAQPDSKQQESPKKPDLVESDSDDEKEDVSDTKEEAKPDELPSMGDWENFAAS